MRKVLAIVALVAAMFVASNVQAQTVLYGGYAPESFVSGNTSSNYQGFFVGFAKNFGIAQGVGVTAGAQFRMNTASESNTFLGVTSTTKEAQYLIDVPILFNYGISVNRDFKVTPFAGPMLSLALAGNTKYIVGNSTTTSDWYGDNSTMNRFNLYAVFGANVQFSKLNIFGGYRLGLLDLNESNNVILKTNGLFVGLGFKL